MKILLIVPEYPPHSIGGGGEVYKSLAENYVKLGHDITVIYGDYTPRKIFFQKIKTYSQKNILFYRVPELPYPRSMPFLRTVMPPTLMNLFAIKKVIKEHDFDVAHVHGYGYSLMDSLARICYRNNIPFIFTNHGSPKTVYEKGILIKYIWSIYSRIRCDYIYAKSVFITSVSAATLSEIPSKFQKKSSVIRNGIDLIKGIHLSLDERKLLKNELGIKDPATIALSVGRITKHKGYQDVASIIEKDDKIYYLIIGEDAGYKNIIQTIANKNGTSDKIIFVGKIDRSIINKYYQLADVVIIPSQFEAFGLIGLEALKNKKFVLHSGVEGLSYLNKSNNAKAYTYNGLRSDIFSKHTYKREDFLDYYKWSAISKNYLDLIQKACTYKKK